MHTRVFQSENASVKPLVLFYEDDSVFSNFHPAKFTTNPLFGEDDGKSIDFTCSEQYFMYHKALLVDDSSSAMRILRETAPLTMKMIGRQLEMSREQLREWSVKSREVMYKACLEKFAQNPALLIQLLRTRGMILVEASANDAIWGIGLDKFDERAQKVEKWMGKNWLGEILDRIREELWSKSEFSAERRQAESEDLPTRSISAPAGKDVEPVAVKRNEKALTVEAFDGYVGLLKMFKDFFPGDLVSAVDNLNITQKGEVVSFLSNWFQDHLQTPNTTSEVVDLLKTHLPSVYDRIHTLNTTFYTKFNALKPESQTMLREWKAKAVGLFGDRPAGESAAQNLQLLRDFATSIRDVDPSIRDDLKTQFPSAVALTEGLGFTVFTTLVMVVQKILEAAAQPAQAILATGIPVECALPLD
ncbi:unnamed protein product [Caenorhabditis sp. 36 PRJEB53466]|nr:unnamed protein product [Caenorhabditis sp. 36 PRJEB53466]